MSRETVLPPASRPFAGSRAPVTTADGPPLRRLPRTHRHPAAYDREEEIFARRGGRERLPGDAGRGPHPQVLSDGRARSPASTCPRPVRLRAGRGPSAQRRGPVRDPGPDLQAAAGRADRHPSRGGRLPALEPGEPFPTPSPGPHAAARAALGAGARRRLPARRRPAAGRDRHLRPADDPPRHRRLPRADHRDRVAHDLPAGSEGALLRTVGARSACAEPDAPLVED